MFSSSLQRNVTPKRSFTPLELENYVQKVQSRLQSPREKKSKAFAFARLYYDAKDYSTAERYLKDYLSIQDRDFRVYNLLGAVQESLENYQEALTAYKRSLELCSSQKDILIKVIKMCCKCQMDPLRAKVWADKGARLCPGHPEVFLLKWHLLSSQDPKQHDELETLIADELTRHPRDSSLHKKLVENYIDAEGRQEAFLHSQSVEKTGAFNDNIEWLECACDTFDAYQQQAEDNKINAYLSFTSTLCKLMKLHLRKSSTRVCMDTFIRFDNTVQTLQLLEPQDIFSGFTSELKDCVTEMRGQLYLNAAVFIMKLAQENLIPWMKANRMMYAYLMCSWKVSVPVVTPKLFARHSPLKRQNPQAYNWSVLACKRLSQAGHIILSLESEFGEDWQQSCINDLCTDQGQNTILEFLYNGGDRLEESFLAGDRGFLETEFQLPDTQLLVKYDEVTVAENAQDLHLIIWLGLHWDQFREQMRPGVGVMVGRLFEGISLDVKHMNNCHHSSMCLRDVEAFIYGVIRSSKSVHIECHKGEDELKLLPLDICTSLVTKPQQEWWQAAYSLYTGKVGSQSPAKLKVVLQKGLETLRCLKDHGIDPRILIYMSLAFWEKADAIQASKEKEYDYQDHWKSLQGRAVYYMKEAIRILEIFKRNKTIPICENPLIPPLSEPLLIDEVLQLLNKNYMKLGDAAMVDGNLQDALKFYDEVKTLVSTYNQAQIYIRLASKCDVQTVDGEKDQLYYITKAKERLNVCINHSNHSPEFKQTLYEQLHELTMNAIPSASSTMKPIAKKSLQFQADVPDADIEDGESITFNSLDVSSLMEKNLLQEQLEAKENENRSLKQALAMYRAQIEMQKQSSIPPAPPQAHPQQYYPHSQMAPGMMHGMSPGIPPLMPQSPHMSRTPSAMMQQQQGPPPMHPPGVQQVYGMGNMHPQHPQQWARASFGSNPMTPPVLNGMETPSDLWWDSFSPQPSFEKGYFAGLAEHVEQVREESGEGEAPTLRDNATPPSPVKTDAAEASPAVIATTPKSPATLEPDDIYVEPIVKFDEKISDLTTGEEEETPQFAHRAKLYRFDEDANQWKERGIGEVKLLFHDKAKKARITMRRDQVFRVCCNHMITPEMKLSKKDGSANAWTWFTLMDATESRPEKFTIKFKTQEIADDFYEAFEKCKKLLTGELVEKPSTLSEKVDFQESSVLSRQTSNKEPPPSYQESVGLPSRQSVPQGMIDLSASMQKQNMAYVNSMNNTFRAPQPTAFGYQTPPLQQPFQQSPMARLSHFPPGQPAVDQTMSFGENSLNKQLIQQQQPSFLSTMQPATSSQTKQPETKPNPFAGFSFNIKSSPEKTPTAPAPVSSAASASPFSGFSFSGGSTSTTPSTVSSATVNSSIAQQTGSTIPMGFPMMTSLLQDKQQQSSMTKPAVTTPPVSAANDSPSKTIIPGMSKLPVFEKGIVDSTVDPSAFWSNVSPGKNFFTGNTTALETIGHTEAPEPREVDEEEFFKENLEAANEEMADDNDNDDGDDENDRDDDDDNAEDDDNDGEYDNENEYYRVGQYYGENGEYYDGEGDMGNYDYDPDDDFCYDDDDEDADDGDEYQPSKASSSRRASDEEYENTERYRTGNKQVEERFDIQRKSPQGNHNHVIDDDITITFERIPNFSQKIKSSRLQLPSTFYLYESKRPCAGCAGCKDEYSVQDIKSTEVSSVDENVTANATETTAVTAPSGFTFGGQPQQQAGSSFAAIASSFGNVSNSEGAFSGTSGSFSGAGTQIFGAKPSGGTEEVDNDHDPQYDAIVQVAKLHSVKTGEEDDQILFKHRAKIYRFDSQWKERGVGDIKLTKNFKTGYCRVIMRRDQIHKLCANHAVTPRMELKPLNTSDTSWVWFTPSDYSDGLPPIPQQFCVKFKYKEVSEEFRQKFVACQQMMEKILAQPQQETDAVQQQQQRELEHKESKEESKAIPSFLSKSDTTVPPTTASPFASLKLLSNTGTNNSAISSVLQFNSSAASKDIQTKGSSTVEVSDPTSPGYYKDEGPDIHVEAIAQVSKLSSIATGEENEKALFEQRSKLYRYDSNVKSWKERGIGTLKLAWDHNKNTCRVLMRRDQVHKLCANHAIMPEMELKPLHNSDKAWTWFTHADISDGDEAKPENFCAKFKSPEISEEFQLAFEKCKTIVSGNPLKESVVIRSKMTDSDKPGNSLAARFAPKPGSWNCQNCFVANPPTAEKCLACQAPNLDLKEADTTNSAAAANSEKPAFSFVSPSAPNIFGNTNGFSFGKSSGLAATTTSEEPDNEKPVASSFSFEDQQQQSVPKFSFATPNSNTSGFSFGQHTTASNTTATGFGFGNVTDATGFSSNINLFAKTPVKEVDSILATRNQEGPKQNIFAKFAQKSGSWECPICEVNNEESAAACIACTTPNPNAKKETPTGNIFARFAQKPGSWECPICEVNNEESSATCIACTTPNPDAKKGYSNEATGLLFGSSSNNPPSSGFTFGNSNAQSHTTAFSFGSVASTTTSNAGFSFGTPNKQPTAGTGDFRFGPPTLSKNKEDTTESEVSSTTDNSTETKSSGKLDLKLMFAPAPGSWECPTCMINNKPTHSKCLSCQTLNPAGGNEATESSLSTFSFGGKPSSSSSGFSFGSQPASSSSGFSFGPTSTSSGFSFGGNPDVSHNSTFSFPSAIKTSGDSAITPKSSEAQTAPVNKFGADPDTWECVCLAKNAGYREICRLCNAPKQKIPVVRLNPDDHSKPINFSTTEQTAAEKVEVIIVPNVSSTAPAIPTGFSFGSTNPAAFAAADSTTQNVASHSSKPDLSSLMSKAERDRELMPPPPPPGINPVKAKTSPNSKKPGGNKESTFSWVPKGLNTESLFSFGSTPTPPSLSNASSVDDLSVERTESYKSVAAAFTNTSFSFKFETPKKGDSSSVSSPPKTPPSSNISIISVTSSITPEGDGEPNIEFTPLVTLSQVNVQNTGEENDMKMFAERCKMFRYVDSQWKERGVGELKILRSELTNQSRLIMRRDQIHKLCANHMIVEGMDVKPMRGSNKAFIWKSTADISDGGPEEQTFAARFKDEEIANKFSDIFKQSSADAANPPRKSLGDTTLSNSVAEALTGKPGEGKTLNKSVEITTPNAAKEPEVIVISDEEKDDEAAATPTLLQHNNDDVKLTFQPTLPEDLREKARRLLLPSTFYNDPSVKVGNILPAKTVGLSSSGSMLDTGNTAIDQSQRVQHPDLMLTCEQEPTAADQQKAKDLLLPKTFYNNGEVSIATIKNITINQSDEDDEVDENDVFNILEPFNKEISNIVLNEEAAIFKFSPALKTWNGLDNARILIVSPKSFLQSRDEILFVADENVYFKETIRNDLSLEFRPGHQTMLDLVVPSKTPKIEQHYTVDFGDTTSAENFQKMFDDLLSGTYPAPAVSPVFNSNNSMFRSSMGGVSFASLAAEGNSEFRSNAGQMFVGAGASLFGGGASNDNGNQDGGEPEEGSHDVYVEPIVQLATVAVSSGEEHEDTYFNQRCKLYRFDSNVRKWKERGVGEMKLLRHRDTRKARLVMRRDQVRKICANHVLLPTIELKPFATNELTVTWTAFQDISEERAEDVLLAAKFKNDTILTEFKTIFTQLCNDEDSLQPIESSYNPEEGSEVKARQGACDPKLASVMKDLKF